MDNKYLKPNLEYKYTSTVACLTILGMAGVFANIFYYIRCIIFDGYLDIDLLTIYLSLAAIGVNLQIRYRTSLMMQYFTEVNPSINELQRVYNIANTLITQSFSFWSLIALGCMYYASMFALNFGNNIAPSIGVLYILLDTFIIRFSIHNDTQLSKAKNRIISRIMEMEYREKNGKI